jgi:hypothetical protein
MLPSETKSQIPHVPLFQRGIFSSPRLNPSLAKRGKGRFFINHCI